LTIAHQYIEQLGEVVKPAVFGNVGTMICFRVGAEDAAFLVKEFSPQFTEEDFVNLPKYNVYLKLMIDGVSSSPFSAATLPQIKKPTISYVKDIVEGLVALMASEISEPVNLGSEQSYTLTEVAKKVIEMTGSNSSISYTNQYQYSTQPPIPDISKAKEELNWFPLIPIEQGLKEAIDYYKATAFLHKPNTSARE
jgi:hypothetical protein